MNCSEVVVWRQGTSSVLIIYLFHINDIMDIQSVRN